MKIVDQSEKRRTPTPADRRKPVWQHPAYLRAWDHLPYPLQIRLIEIEARLDRAFRRRINVKRHTAYPIKRAVLVALIAAAARAIAHILQTRH